MLVLDFDQNIAWRLVLATLSGQPVRITKIRPEEGGLKDYEVTFLRILDTITNGSVLEISQTGTTVTYKPGLVIGGAHQFNCPLSRGVGYFIEPLLVLAPFSKQPVSLTFNGVTSCAGDVGIDTIRTVLFPTLLKFGITDCELKINKRGSLPLGGGQVVLRVNNQLLQPKTLHLTDPFSINKIRGVCYSTRVSPASVNRTIEAARAALKPTNVDTFIYSDVTKGQDSGSSPGFGITLVAETKLGLPISAESIAVEGTVPEELGAECGQKLYNEISKRGALSTQSLALALVLMTLGSEDIGRLLIGEKQLNGLFVLLLRDIAKFWPGTHAVFKENVDDKGNCLMLLKGTGFVNANKKIA